MTNETELRSRHAAAETATETPATAVTQSSTTETVQTPSGESAPAAEPIKATSFEMTTEEVQKLERDMQTKPASEVVLPDGRTLEKLLQDRDALQRVEGAKASEEHSAAMQADTSAVLPEKHRVTISEAGDLIIAPISDAPADDAKPAESK